jgi:hypothetical protein
MLETIQSPLSEATVAESEAMDDHLIAIQSGNEHRIDDATARVVAATALRISEHDRVSVG